MSGICGAWSIDGGCPVLEPTLTGLERRGPDRTRIWSAGPVALGQTLLATTSEAAGEILPLNDPKSGCTITADARLDNRGPLIAALGLAGNERGAGDGELILLAYLKWGEDCPKQLLGDFAFAIWDPRTQQWFCARDHMGMRQLLYHHSAGKFFAFATEADALVAHPQVPMQVNRGRIADYLDGLEGVDFVSTFFDDIFRLPPAHALVVDRGGLHLRRYWELQPPAELKLGSDQEYADAFLTVFNEAVRCRLRSALPVGAMLSGGLDSNSIAAVAGAQLAAAGETPLQTFSAIDTGDESDAIGLAIESPNFSPTLIRRDQPSRWVPDVVPTTEQCAEPFDAYVVISKAIYGAARRKGLNVVLDGVSADVIFTAGNRVAGLLGAGKIGAAAKEARLEERFWGPSWPAGKVFVSAAWTAFAPSWLRQMRRKLGWWIADRKMRLGRGIVSRELAAAGDLARRRQRFRAHLPTGPSHELAYRVESVRHPHLVAARERYDRVAAAYGVEPRDPFMDIRVIQFALSLPPSQVQAGGWPKIILRRAMKGKIPEAIAWRRGKSHVGWAFMTELLTRWRNQLANQVSVARVLPLIGKRRRSNIGSARNSPGWLKTLILSHWLERRGIGAPELGR